MERGTISFTNFELDALYELALEQKCGNQDLMQKLLPVPNVAPESMHEVLLSEEEVESLLDCMPVPSAIQNESIKTARIKVQKFLAYHRFGTVLE